VPLRLASPDNVPSHCEKNSFFTTHAASQQRGTNGPPMAEPPHCWRNAEQVSRNMVMEARRPRRSQPKFVTSSSAYPIRLQCGGSPRPVRPAKLRRWFFLGAEWAQLGLRQVLTN
jgi:hypothetical protein